MKEKLIKIINKIIELLVQCNYHKKSRWFSDKIEIFMNNPVQSEEFQSSLKEIKTIVGGMGSFSDLAMIPDKGSNLTEESAMELQWDLSENLFDEITKLLIKE